jgi:hypothetical protein
MSWNTTLPGAQLRGGLWLSTVRQSVTSFCDSYDSYDSYFETIFATV